MKLTSILVLLGLFLLCTPLHAQGKLFAYVVNEGSNSISVYSVDHTTGALAPVSVMATGSIPTSIATDPAGRFAFVANNAETAGLPTISVYAIEPNTGALTQIPGSPFPTSVPRPNGMAVHPSGKFLYVANNWFSGYVSAFRIDDGTGVLTTVPGSPYPTGGHGAWSVVTDPAGKFLFVANGGNANVPVFNIDSNTGALTPVAGSPFPLLGYTFVDVVDPTGRFLYLSTDGANVSGFSIDSSSGALTPVAGSPFPAGSFTTGVAMHPTGHFLYAANQNSRNVSAYRLDSSTGALSPVQGSPFPAGIGAFYPTVDPTGSFLYVVNAYSNNVSAYTISADTGALTPIPGSPFATGTEPVWIAVINEIPTSAMSILPTHGGNAGTVSGQIFGSGFQSGATVKLTGLGPDIIGSNATVVIGAGDYSVLTATFDLTGATPGIRNVVITNPDGTTATLTGGFTVEQGGAAQISVSIIGRNALRLGFPQAFYLMLNNKGNLDASSLAASVGISAPISVQVPDAEALADAYHSGTVGQVETFVIPNLAAGSIQTIPFTLTAPPGATTFSIRAQQQSMSPLPTGSQSIVGTANTASITSLFWGLLFGPPLFDGCSQPLRGCTACEALWNRYNAQLDLATYAMDASHEADLAFDYEALLVASDIVEGSAAIFEISLIAPEFLGTIGLAGDAASEEVVSALLQYGHDAFKGILVNKPSDGATATANLVLELSQFKAIWNSKFAPLIKTADAQAKAKAFLEKLDYVETVVSSLSSAWTDLTGLWQQREAQRSIFVGANTNLCSAVSSYLQCLNTSCGGGKSLPPDTGSDDADSNGPAVSSLDPNDKIGPIGIASSRFISATAVVPYSVYFENQPTATAPAQSVTITDTLNPNLDLTFLTLGPITLPNQVVTPPSIPLSVSPFSTTVDLRPTTNLLVKINASLNTTTRNLKWTFQSLDPTTNQPPTDPLAGFLPPGAEGSVFFTVMPKAGIDTGTVIQNQATVVFDVNAPINTPTWSNTLDNTPPISHVLSLPSTESSASFIVQWTGSDAGSGIQDFTIYVSDNGGPYTIWQQNTTATSASFSGQSGHTYAFYSIARDLTGNIEAPKTLPEASTTVVLPSCAANVTNQLSITRSGYTYNFATGRFSQTVTLKNTGASAVSGPIALALDSLSTNATLYNGSGTTSCAAPLGSPYMNVSATGLGSGASVSVVLQFTNPTKAAISYNPRLLAGNGTR